MLIELTDKEYDHLVIGLSLRIGALRAYINMRGDTENPEGSSEYPTLCEARALEKRLQDIGNDLEAGKASDADVFWSDDYVGKPHPYNGWNYNVVRLGFRDMSRIREACMLAKSWFLKEESVEGAFCNYKDEDKVKDWGRIAGFMSRLMSSIKR